ncbi:tyrosine-type recombinase/integrase [Nocardia terpenica]|uniref:Tyrosine-type recombinase/integrase n=1 Tax=Nocardia terpenica TaxID=455432 RepID=A0A6G9ZE61_9NOCA|nr:site-specific integrase [Nocardia terpenica]QIS23730.1 tyrosine-type recombinase/integrase [Nocardia terpenica]
MTDTLTTKSHEAVAILLESLGIEVDDLLAVARGRTVRKVPTFAEYIPVVVAAMPKGATLVQYSCYWSKLLAEPGWADRRLDEPTVTELKALIELFRARRHMRANDRGGHAVTLHVVAALRCLYSHAQDDGLIDAAGNVAARLPKPARLPSSRLAIPDKTLTQINRFTATTGNDPELDTLLIRLHTETACRVCGALRLRPQDLDPVQLVILLREKGGTERWQPVSPTLMTGLLDHQRDRGAALTEPLLRFPDGRPLTAHRHKYIWRRLRKHVPEVAARGISTHWIRHTTITWVERHFGKAVARKFAGHKIGSGSVTDIYTEATIEEVATAVAALTGEPHPLAAGMNPASAALATWPSVGGQR